MTFLTLKDSMVKLVSDTGAAGLSVEEVAALMNHPAPAVQSTIAKLVLFKRLFCGKQPNARVWRYFGTEALRDAWQMQFGRPEPALEKKRQFTIHADRPKAAKVGSGEAVIPANVRRTVQLAPPPRFAPAAGFRGEFSRAGIGRDVDAGKPWGQRA